MKYQKGDYVIYRNKKRMIKEISAFVCGITYYNLVGNNKNISERDLTPYTEITKTEEVLK